MKRFLLPFLFAPALLACEGLVDKYEEGPYLSPYTAEDRVTNTWEWAYFEENGINRSGEHADSTLHVLDSNRLQICGPNNACREGTWRLISKNTQLQLIFGQEAIAYTIVMLKKDEMWLSHDTSDSTRVFWQLVPVE